MAKKKLTFEKRSREIAKQKKRKDKTNRRAERKEEKDNRPESECEGDPDLEGINVGPQPIPKDLY